MLSFICVGVFFIFIIPVPAHTLYSCKRTEGCWSKWQDSPCKSAHVLEVSKVQLALVVSDPD